MADEKAEKEIQGHIVNLRLDDAQIKFEAALKLDSIGAPAVPALAEALASKDKKTRSGAAYALGFFGKKAVAAIPALAKALKDPEEDVRSSAAFALGTIGAQAILPLIKALEDPSKRVRDQAACALGKNREEAIPFLAKAVDGDDELTRISAVKALGNVGISAVPALAKAGKRHWELRNEINGVFRKIILSGIDKEEQGAREGKLAAPDETARFERILQRKALPGKAAAREKQALERKRGFQRAAAKRCAR